MQERQRVRERTPEREARVQDYEWNEVRGREANIRQKLIQDYKAHFANPYSAAERGYIDDVIEPQDTRPRLIRALRMLQTKRVEQPKRKHGNIPL